MDVTCSAWWMSKQSVSFAWRLQQWALEMRRCGALATKG